MAGFTRNRPTASEIQSLSQPLIRDNFNSSDDTFGIDHYKFSDTSPNNGFHNTVTQPIIAPVPPSMVSVHPTTTTNPIIYAMQDSANIGVIQYSKPPNDMWQTPITFLQSPNTPISLAFNATTTVLDFTGITFAICKLFSVNVSDSASNRNVITVSDVLFHLMSTGPTPVFAFNTSGSSSFVHVSSGSILKIGCNNASGLSNIFWTLTFKRIVV